MSSSGTYKIRPAGYGELVFDIRVYDREKEAIEDLLGAIVYTAAMVLARRETQISDHGK